MTNLVLQRYKTIKTHFASDFGPPNLSGIQFDLKENIEQAEAELLASCPALHDINRLLRQRLDDLYNYSTNNRNTDPVVKEIVGVMHNMAFETEALDPVASHPLPGLMISYMAGLAGYISPDPLASERYRDMVKKLDARIAELEELE